MEDLLVVIVTYNSSGHVRAAVESCLRQNLTTCVVDNGSSDGTLSEIPDDPRVRVIAGAGNLGFAGGVNRAVRETGTPFYLLLNPDAELLDPVGPLLDAVQGKGHSAAAGLLVDPHGTPQKGFSFRRLPTAAALVCEVLGINRIWSANPVNRRYRCLDLDSMQSQLVEQPAGACLLFRRLDWVRLNGFDEGFFPVWFEDVDFCRRLANLGGTVWFDSAVRVRHQGGHSVQKIEVGTRQRIWYGSLLKYASKHFRPFGRRFVALAVALVIVPRLLLTSGGDGIHSKLYSIKFIWRLAWRCFRGEQSARIVSQG